MGFSSVIINLVLSAIVATIVIITIEAKLYPDLKTLKEEKEEYDSMPDKPYTCMFNPFIPAVGIMMSGITIGYID